MRCGFRRLFHRVVGFSIEQAGDERARHHAVVHDGRGALHVVVGGATSGDVAAERVHDLEGLARVVGVGWHGDPFGTPLPKRRGVLGAEAGFQPKSLPRAERRDRGSCRIAI